MSRNDPQTRLSPAGWLALIVLLTFLAAAIWYGVHLWGALGDVSMTTFGWVMLVGGSLITIAVGGVLMALVFYSSREKFDR